MKALVVGYGSIGARHARILTELNCNTRVVSSRKVDFPDVFASIREALESDVPHYVVIANVTAEHYDTLKILSELGYKGTVLVEKPLYDKCIGLPDFNFDNSFVAYNLRFHPVIQKLKAILKNREAISVQAYVGQYLPTWRPLIDYRSSYSASKVQGGGVLRDLSHELDYLTWLFGGWRKVAALGGHFSQLEISSDDVYSLLLVTAGCPVVTIQMNYLDRVARRQIIINTTDHSIKADLINGTLSIDGTDESFAVDRDITYKSMHSAILSNAVDDLCTIEEAFETMKLIEASELSAESGKWVAR